jgi:hypothetical protein
MNTTQTPLSDRELDALIFSLLDGEITPDAHAKLQALLKGDATCRARYRELSQLHVIMEERFSGGVSLLKEGCQSVIPLSLVLHRQRKRIIRFSLMAAAALLFFSLVVMHLMNAKIDTLPMAKVAFSAHSIFKMKHPNGTPEDIPKDRLVPGSSIRIDQGALKLEIANGVTSVIQSPALVTFMDENKVVVHNGKAWFHVEPEAVGFTLLTPQLEIIDLGTEFGVSVDPSTALEEVHVFKGKVKVTSRHKFQRTETLVAGESRSVQISGQLHHIASQEDQYLTSLPSSLPSVSWSFDTFQQRQTKTEQVGMLEEFQSLITRGDLTQVAGKKGKAIQLQPDGGFIGTGWRGIGLDRPRTVVCWIKCPKGCSSGSMIEWGIPLTTSAKWRVGLNLEQQGEGGVQGALRTEFGRGYVIGSTDLRDGQWHQIISIYDGSKMGNPDSIQLYVDGKKEVISKYVEKAIQTILDNPQSKPVTIGEGFNGCIDELRVYEGVMPLDALSLKGIHNREDD